MSGLKFNWRNAMDDDTFNDVYKAKVNWDFFYLKIERTKIPTVHSLNFTLLIYHFVIDRVPIAVSFFFFCFWRNLFRSRSCKIRSRIYRKGNGPTRSPKSAPFSYAWSATRKSTTPRWQRRCPPPGGCSPKLHSRRRTSPLSHQCKLQKTKTHLNKKTNTDSIIKNNKN